MRGLHAFVMAGKVLYLGVSDTPAWIVVKANDCTPPSVPNPHCTKPNYFILITSSRR